MAGTQVLSPEEVQLVQQPLEKPILTDDQIKAAYAYRRSVGGLIGDILVKFGMLRRYELDSLADGKAREANANGSSKTKVQHDTIDHSCLKIQHRILDKLPLHLVEQHFLLIFFPTPSSYSCKPVLGHGCPLSDESRDWIRSTLGIEIYTLALTEGEAAKHLIHYLERGGRPVSRKLRQVAESALVPVDEPPEELDESTLFHVEGFLKGQALDGGLRDTDPTLDLPDKDRMRSDNLDRESERSESTPTLIDQALVREHQGDDREVVNTAAPSRGGLVSDTVEDSGYRDATAQETSRGFGDRVFANEATKTGQVTTVELKWEALLNLLLKRKCRRLRRARGRNRAFEACSWRLRRDSQAVNAL